jgi:hypothetical protein
MKRIVVINISDTYQPGMSCCQIRWCATQAWTASGIYDQIFQYPDEPVYVIAVIADGTGNKIVVGTFCLLGIAKLPLTRPNAYNKFAFWLKCTNPDCDEMLKAIFYAIQTDEPQRFFGRFGVRYIKNLDIENHSKKLPEDCCKNVVIRVFDKPEQIPTWKDDKTKCTKFS